MEVRWTWISEHFCFYLHHTKNQKLLQPHLTILSNENTALYDTHTPKKPESNSRVRSVPSNFIVQTKFEKKTEETLETFPNWPDEVFHNKLNALKFWHLINIYNSSFFVQFHATWHAEQVVSTIFSSKIWKSDYNKNSFHRSFPFPAHSHIPKKSDDPDTVKVANSGGFELQHTQRAAQNTSFARSGVRTQLARQAINTFILLQLHQLAIISTTGQRLLSNRLQKEMYYTHSPKNRLRKRFFFVNLVREVLFGYFKSEFIVRCRLGSRQSSDGKDQRDSTDRWDSTDPTDPRDSTDSTYL